MSENLQLSKAKKCVASRMAEIFKQTTVDDKENKIWQMANNGCVYVAQDHVHAVCTIGCYTRTLRDLLTLVDEFSHTKKA